MELYIARKVLDVKNIEENKSKSELREYHQFLRSGVHILEDDPNALLQLALNMSDSSPIYKEAGTLSYNIIYCYILMS